MVKKRNIFLSLIQRSECARKKIAQFVYRIHAHIVQRHTENLWHRFWQNLVSLLLVCRGCCCHFCCCCCRYQWRCCIAGLPLLFATIICCECDAVFFFLVVNVCVVSYVNWIICDSMPFINSLLNYGLPYETLPTKMWYNGFFGE